MQHVPPRLSSRRADKSAIATTTLSYPPPEQPKPMRTQYSLLFLLFLCTSASAQEANPYNRFPLPANQAAIQSPADYLGYQLGERFTEYARSTAYFRYLAEASPRIILEEYGETYEGRPLVLLTMSAEENMGRLEEIRTGHLALVDRAGADEDTDDLLGESRDLPVINSFSYNIHGNEASSTEAAMQVAYEVATTRDPALLDALTNSIVLSFVTINPDGRDRYVYWANGMKRATGGEEPRDLEHYAPWPNGRTNHYWFDLNRDWIWGVHPESRGQVAAYQRWLPQVHTDYHEQGYDANYFTVPGTTPRNLLLPDDYEVFADTFGRANIEAFNTTGVSYFTRDRFDFFYPGYGSSYPSVMGAIGMLTEQGGIGANLAVETEDDYVLTLRQRVWDHYSTSIAQIKAAARNREALRGYGLDAMRPAGSKADDIGGYLIRDDGNVYLPEVIDMLLRHGVTVQQQRDGSFFVPSTQSRHLFVHSVLSPTMAIEDSVMYDMSTWSALHAYNLDAEVSQEGAAAGAVNVEKAMIQAGRVTRHGSGRPYAFVIDWNQRNAPTALARLWEKDYRVRAAHEPFMADDDAAFGAGSLIVLTGRNHRPAAEIDADMSELAEAHGVRIDRFTTGRMATGMDLASTRNFPVKQPKAAMLVEPPFNTYTSGQLYFLFDREVQLPVDRLRASTLQQTAIPKFGSRYGLADLNDYDVLILPDAGGLNKLFDKDGRKEVMNWVKAGGTLIAIGSSAEWLTDVGKLLPEQKLVDVAKDSSETAATVAFADRTDYFGKQRTPGAALNSTVDNHPPVSLRNAGDGLQPEVRRRGPYAGRRPAQRSPLRR